MTEKPPPEILAARAAAERRLATLRGCALLVGVEEYAAFDPTHGRDLLAGRNDVLSYWKVCRRLGYRAEDIRVRTSPILTKEEILQAETELGLERRRGKTRAEVAAIVQ